MKLIIVSNMDELLQPLEDEGVEHKELYALKFVCKLEAFCNKLKQEIKYYPVLVEIRVGDITAKFLNVVTDNYKVVYQFTSVIKKV